jgi:hypothetical protein
MCKITKTEIKEIKSLLYKISKVEIDGSDYNELEKLANLQEKARILYKKIKLT